MSQAKLYWDKENYPQVEKIFRKSVEFCSDRDEWKLNVAHVLFMQDKFKESCGFYQTVVKKHYDNVIIVIILFVINDLYTMISC
jgi:tetratricopeptide repeat protein 30